MSCRISELVLNCADPELLARFWRGVLGYVEPDREDGAIEIGPPAGFGGLQPTIFLSPSSNPRVGRLPLHIDVNPVDRDQDAELERLLALERGGPTSGRPARSNGTSCRTPKETSSASCASGSIPEMRNLAAPTSRRRPGTFNYSVPASS
ncbi:hypothetical protein GCM10007170_07390 [Arthrobacter liuii]|uniref:Glyoxalase-like domain-containing protein n=1 Tax=Arthrobacter liuii TaxID=1476996 RepID=A0ABQ2AKX9_9MICC|nr:hypothetical protein GCM10007170_07390 [Arthrobacter liuii]